MRKITGEGYFDFDIVGEQSYQGVLGQIAGPKTEDGVEFVCEAVVKPEPENPHDSNAVAVYIRGQKVGYLSRTEAKAWVAALSRNGLSGQPFLVDAMIVGGWRRPGSEGNYGVKLDIEN